MNEIPNHIAIIMDGNRRWAENKKINKINGHKKGIEIAKNIAIESHKIGVKNLTLYAFSFQNWNRPKIEVESLFKLFNDLFEDKSKFFKDNGFVFNPIGRLDELNNLMRKKISTLYLAIVCLKTLILKKVMYLQLINLLNIRLKQNF